MQATACAEISASFQRQKIWRLCSLCLQTRDPVESSAPDNCVIPLFTDILPLVLELSSHKLSHPCETTHPKAQRYLTSGTGTVRQKIGDLCYECVNRVEVGLCHSYSQGVAGYEGCACAHTEALSQLPGWLRNPPPSDEGWSRRLWWYSSTQLVLQG